MTRERRAPRNRSVASLAAPCPPRSPAPPQRVYTSGGLLFAAGSSRKNLCLGFCGRIRRDRARDRRRAGRSALCDEESRGEADHEDQACGGDVPPSEPALGVPRTLRRQLFVRIHVAPVRRRVLRVSQACYGMHFRRDIADTLGVFRGAVPGEHGFTLIPEPQC